MHSKTDRTQQVQPVIWGKTTVIGNAYTHSRKHCPHTQLDQPMTKPSHLAPAVEQCTLHGMNSSSNLERLTQCSAADQLSLQGAWNLRGRQR